MHIVLEPMNRPEMLTLSVIGDKVVVNGEEFDFAQVGEGDTLPQSAIRSDWFFGDVKRTGGVLELSIMLPHGPNAPESTRFPQPITITNDGPVELPIYDEPPAQVEPEEGEPNE